MSKLDDVLVDLESACTTEASAIAEALRDGTEGLTGKERAAHALAMAKEFVEQSMAVVLRLEGRM